MGFRRSRAGQAVGQIACCWELQQSFMETGAVVPAHLAERLPILLIGFLYLLLTIKAVIRSHSYVSHYSPPPAHARIHGAWRWRDSAWPPAAQKPSLARRACDMEHAQLSRQVQFFSVWFIMTMVGCGCLIILSLGNLINIKAHSPLTTAPKLACRARLRAHLVFNTFVF